MADGLDPPLQLGLTATDSYKNVKENGVALSNDGLPLFNLQLCSKQLAFITLIHKLLI